MRQIGKKTNKERVFVFITFLVITLGFYFFLFTKYTPIFGINDDWTVYMVLSGSYLGEPDPYILFFLYPLAWLISLLYRITATIPWYGLFLHGCFILAGFWIFYRCFYWIRGKKIKVIFSTSALLMFWFSSLSILNTIQYTHSATVCGASAIFCFFTADTKEKDEKGFLFANLPTLLMAGLALCIRKNAAFMCLPVAGMLFLVKYVIEEKKVTREGIKKYVGFAIALLLMIGVLLLSQEIAYSSDEWSEYADVNYYREKVVDFYGTLSYEEMEDVIREVGMSEEQYNISREVLNYYTGNIPYSEFLKIMMERSKEKYDVENPLTDRIIESTGQIFTSLKDKNLMPQNCFVLLLGIFLFMCFLVSKKWMGIFALTAWQFGRLFAWYYILLNGRFPLRIPQSLFLIDIMAILAISIYFANDFLTLQGAKKRFLYVGGIAFGGLALLFGYQGIQKVEQDTAYVEIYQDRWYGVKEYCMANPQNMYLLNGGSQTLFYFSDDVLDTSTIGHPQNYYANSNFYSLSPNFYKKTGIEPGSDVAEAILEQDNNYWIYETGCFTEELSIVQYYKKRYDSFTYELTDTFTTETSSFEVYRFQK